jgi:hypothetical protein
MRAKWFQKNSWRGQNNLNGSLIGFQDRSENTSETSLATGSEKEIASMSINGSERELQSFEEIYTSAGIRSPKLGYSIMKVIDMLDCEHIRDLSKDTKRASLLMALDAAGVPVDEVLQDAMLRQHALNSYETAQRRRVEEYEARKNQENQAIQAEMDRVMAQYLARINATLDEIAREKDGLRKWQMRKEEEAQRIAEGVSLCVKHSGSQASSDPMLAVAELTSLSKPSYSKR